MSGTKTCLVALTALFLTGAMPAASRAASVSVVNQTSTTIFVSVAYNFFRGDLIVEGWYRVNAGDTFNFNADDASDLYVRVENQNGGEINFSNHDTYGYWPAIGQRYKVSRTPGDDSIWQYRWGNNFESARNLQAKGDLPPGWEKRRFFRIGSGQHNLTVNP
jgi:hypothetical protein